MWKLLLSKINLGTRTLLGGTWTLTLVTHLDSRSRGTWQVKLESQVPKRDSHRAPKDRLQPKPPTRHASHQSELGCLTKMWRQNEKSTCCLVLRSQHIHMSAENFNTIFFNIIFVIAD